MDNTEPSKPRPADIRMRGFGQRATVEQAWEWIDAQWVVDATIPSSATESVPSTNACGRVLTEGIRSDIDVPSFRRSMMDGYAIQSADLLAPDCDLPAELSVAGTVFPGKPFERMLRRGEALRIMTGAPVPAETDVVVPVELTKAAGEDRIQILERLLAGKHVGTIGEDIAIGDEVLPAGRRLRPQDIGVLCSIGVRQVEVRRAPRVRIVVTGNEMLPPDSLPQPHKIVDSNSPMLRGLIARDGGVVTSSQIMPDDPDAILAAMQDEVDLVIVSGGTSVGEEDYGPHLLAEHGDLAIHGITLRPGGPTGMGRLDERLVFLLPGNPVSCLCAYELFAGRALRARSGHGSAVAGQSSLPHRTTQLPMAESLTSRGGRFECARVDVVDGAVVPLAIAGSSMLSSTTRAAGLVLIPAEVELLSAGENVTVYLFD